MIKKVSANIITALLTVVVLYISTSLFILALYSASYFLTCMIYLFTGYGHPLMYVINIIAYEGLSTCIYLVHIFLIYQLISDKPIFDTYETKTLYISFFLPTFSFISTIISGLIKYESYYYLLLDTVDVHIELYVGFIFYFLFYLTQNFLSVYRNCAISKYIYLGIILTLFIFWWNFLAYAFHKNLILRFLS